VTAKCQVGLQAKEQGKKIAEKWAQKLALAKLTLGEGDKINITSAAAIVAEFASREHVLTKPTAARKVGS
jgi:hypothetical protein